MRSADRNPLDLKHRFFYGAVVGSIVGMIIGTMPGNDPALGLASMGVGALGLGSLAALSTSFWDSLLAAWELVRVAFWRW